MTFQYYFWQPHSQKKVKVFSSTRTHPASCHITFDARLLDPKMGLVKDSSNFDNNSGIFESSLDWSGEHELELAPELTLMLLVTLTTGNVGVCLSRIGLRY